ncbi:hypothetical protein LWI29_034953 [Acer saccharum]|uniref:Protein kinase domain-containing protein n=1 Tax=Acer saccharum TaxID=4024 RepID=A0AA39SPM2_ACESA|nr:hypothetical protein LWI29_034953 [Acer saccharum]
MCLRLVLVQLLLLMVANAALTTTQLAQRPKPADSPDCLRKCGELESIPYPFGTEYGCFLNKDFFINCKYSDNKPPIPFWGDSDIRVTNITMDGQLQVQSNVSIDCYDEKGNKTLITASSLYMDQYTISDTQNKFTLIGCDSVGYIQGTIGKKNYSAGCISSCDRLEDVTNGSCSGFGCCQIDIPEGLKGIEFQAYSLNNHTNVSQFNPCSYAFVIEDSRFNFSSSNLSATFTETVPTAVDWTITGQGKCEEARKNQSYACKENSDCYEPGDHSAGGYLCKCKDGYHGNPYISNDCKDIDECAENANICGPEKYCENYEGGFNCSSSPTAVKKLKFDMIIIAYVPIYHRDIKTSNILLDDKYRAKVADFGTSRSIPVDDTHLTTKVQGTFGYFDPEYFQSNQFTDKSDVYSFGVVLIELLMGQKPVFSTVTEEGRSLASYFINSMEENKVCDILDAQVKLGKEEEIMVMANLAIRCLNLQGKQRPTMREVAMELEGIRPQEKNK